MLAPCQASEEESDADEVDEGLGRARMPLVVLAQSALPAQPGEGPLDDPAARQHMEPGRLAQIRQEIGRVAFELAPVRIDHLDREAVPPRRPALQ